MKNFRKILSVLIMAIMLTTLAFAGNSGMEGDAFSDDVVSAFDNKITMLANHLAGTTTLPADENFDAYSGDSLCNISDLVKMLHLRNQYVEVKSRITDTAITSKLVIPLEYTKTQYNAAVGADVNYITAFIDDEIDEIALALDSSSFVVTDPDTSIRSISSEYSKKLCIYTKDTNGLYHISSLLAVSSENSNNVGVNSCYDVKSLEWKSTDISILEDSQDTTTKYIISDIDGIRLEKVADGIFEVNDQNGDSVLVRNGGQDFAMSLTDKTKIIIKDTKGTNDNIAGNERVEYIIYDKASFEEAPDVQLENVSLILTNSLSQNSENLLVMYGETIRTNIIGNYPYRIISSMPFGVIDEDGLYRYSYSTLNPYSGKNEDNVPGSARFSSASSMSTSLSAGSVIELNNGVIDDTSAVSISTFDISSTAGMMPSASVPGVQTGIIWITGYDSSTGVLSAAKADGYWYDAQTTYTFKVTPNTAAALLKHDNKDMLCEYGSLSHIETDVFSSIEEDYRCFNRKVSQYVVGGVTNFRKGFAKYIKAYIIAEDKSSLAAGELNEVKAAFVLVHGEENKTFLVTTRKPDNS